MLCRNAKGIRRPHRGTTKRWSITALPGLCFGPSLTRHNVWNRTERPSVKLQDGVLVPPRGVCPMLQKKATSQMDQSFLFAHRSNIERYERLLQTHLTDLERDFIQRRLDEERRALALYATDVA